MTETERSLDPMESTISTLIGCGLMVYCMYLFWGSASAVFQSADTAWLIKTGQYILQNGLPKSDIFSWTCYGQSWVVYQWLFECALGWLFGAGGLWLVGLFSCLMAACVYFFILPAQMLRQGVQLPYVFGLLSMVVSPYGFWARPQQVSFILIPVFITILERVRTRGHSRTLWLLPPLMVLWVNCHSFWFIGLLMIAAYGISMLSSEVSRRVRVSYLSVLLLSAMAVLVNPYGWSIITYNLSFLTQPDFKNIQELQPLLFSDPMASCGFICYLTIAWLVLIAGRKKVPLAGLILGAAGTAAACLVHRFVPVAVLLTWPFVGMILAASEHTGQQAVPARRQNSLTLLVLASIAIMFPITSFTIQFPRSERLWFTHKNSNQEAIQFLSKHPELTRKLFSDPDVGCSQILEGMLPVFVDSRFDMYGSKFCDEYTNCMKGRKGWSDYLKKWNISTICITTECGLYRELKRTSGWLTVFDNGLTSIWLQNTKSGRNFLVSTASKASPK